MPNDDSSLKNGLLHEYKLPILGLLGSVALLAIFSFLKATNASFIELPTQWLAFAALPTIVALVCGGYIESFSGFGVKLEASLKAPATSIDMKATEAVSEMGAQSKGSVSAVAGLSPERKREIGRLSFVDKMGYYHAGAIIDYMKQLPNLEFFEVKKEDGTFVGLVPTSIFHNPDESEGFDWQKLQTFVDALSAGEVLQAFQGIVLTDAVQKDTNLLDIANHFRAKGVEAGAIVDAKGTFIGVIKRQDVERRIVDGLLNAKKS
ncbi:MAG: hypothetical protein AAFX93_03785 [Verrucomicrobiota bacterium]